MSEVSAPPNAGLQSAFRTDPGRVRTNNEDIAIVEPDRGVYGVIDGVGGHAAGEIAAAIARDVILQRLARPLGTAVERVREAIAIANNEIFRRASESPAHHGMTCVVTLALVSDGHVTIGHVGDSRLYKLQAGGIRKLTHDHSPIGEREDAREITEVEAMRHPRRNEVFRDVGSTYRDKDEPDFVEIVEETMEPDCALLLCTDGLTDMVPAVELEQIVRRRAGRPREVVDALVGAANDAGGKDNITVVYAEAPGFARAAAAARHAGPVGDTAPAPARGSHAARFGGWVVRSRTTWFALGAFAGVMAALALAWRLGNIGAAHSRTLVVGPEGVGEFTQIADAMHAARAGDVVRLEPGIYRERVVVPDGVDLVARSPGSVTVMRAPDAADARAAVAVVGGANGRLSGFRIESTRDLPIDVGIRVVGHGRTIDRLDLSGPMRTGIELAPASEATIHGSLFAVQGPALTMGERSEATLTNNTFLHVAQIGDAPIAVGVGAQATLLRNVFAGFGQDIFKGVPADARRQMLTGNFVIASEPALVR